MEAIAFTRAPTLTDLPVLESAPLEGLSGLPMGARQLTGNCKGCVLNCVIFQY